MRNVDPDGQFSRDTLLGYMNALVSDLAFGLGRMDSASSDFQQGQKLGDGAAQKVGAALTLIGATTTTGGLVAEAPTLGGSTLVVAGGLATAGYGAVVTAVSTNHLMSQSNGGQGSDFDTRGLERQLAEHERKLAEYKANPEAHDNKGFLKNAPSEEARNKIIKSRIRNLEGQIDNFRRLIASLRMKAQGK
jgi:hypothetical protein